MKLVSTGKQEEEMVKTRKIGGEVNYSPDYPAGQSDDTLEQERLILVEELKKKTTNEIISQKMSLTFSLRRKEIVEVVPMVSEVLERWPALSLPNEIGNEFKRITNVDLLSTFRSSLHQHAPQLLKLYRARQGAFGKELEDLLNKLDLQTSNIINHRKQAVLKVSLCSSVKILLHCLEMSGHISSRPTDQRDENRNSCSNRG
ncbi:uncharacterized protein LOC124395026 [Silurus meridionalis]|uniref:uncharacterized protein LOC124395026 n=1 Tax=Silurus meridionalis TaxID=175797 RepID=UPI001EEC14C7|nr:uncharacterized protein LOC124395026 [Silurus meridionalis]